MIDILRKEDCTGCSACVERCPAGCIAFERDEQGFRYPKVDASRCIGCSLCEKVCPVLNQSPESEPQAVYGAVNKAPGIVATSSSGGIFFALAEMTIKKGGVVFGARFDRDFNVIHSFAETLDGLSPFQGSKYVQSDMRDSFRRAEEFLKQGRRVLFSGTPCQIAALGLFLRKDYGEQLLKVDVICHGVPSPLVWRNYLREDIGTPEEISHISFRDKRDGWNSFGFSFLRRNHSGETSTYVYEPMRTNAYMQAFLRDLTLRPSCFACPAKGGRSHSDITLGDFWRVEHLEPAIASASGTSLVLLHSEKALNAIQGLDLFRLCSTYDKACLSNPSIVCSVQKPKLYNVFWENYIETPEIETLRKFVKKARPSVLRCFINRTKQIIYSLVGPLLRR